MGGEFGQWREWDHDSSLDWHLLEKADHAGLWQFVADLNRIYLNEKPFYDNDFNPSGFRWIDCADSESSILSFLRTGQNGKEVILAAFNFTPVPRFNYRVGAPFKGKWKEILNSDGDEYGGEGYGNFGQAVAQVVPVHNQPYSLSLTLPPLGALFFKPQQ
jgi:1,4-alpha-glucan branching enzyme